MQLYVSPHLDDAVLSCGGMIARTRRGAGRAVVLTVFASGPRGGKLTPYAARYHAKCGIADLWTRRWEDIEACELLGAELIHLQFPEILYRRDHHGRPRCRSRHELFSQLRPDDTAVVAEVTSALAHWIRRLSPATVYGPVGLGEHVDHVATNAALRQAISDLGADAPRLLLYEEMPYAALNQASTANTAAALRHLKSTATPNTHRLTEEDWAHKIRAIEAYRSQLPSIWHGTDWRAELRAYAQQLVPGGLGEQTWTPTLDRSSSAGPADADVRSSGT